MTAPIRVLVVDDSVVIRRLVTDVLAADPAIEVIGTASNGRLAVEKVGRLEPDLVTLDVEMPDMNGLEALAAIRRDYPRLPVVMFSTLTERGAAITIDALVRGANDYVTKPANVGSVAEALEQVRSALVPKIKTLCPRRGASQPPARPAPRPPVPDASQAPARAVPRSALPVEAVVVGVSTGGPNALAALIPRLPADLAAPVLIVQHMPPMFTGLLAERLDATSPLRVAEATAGVHPAPGQVWIAPGDRHLEVVAGDGGPSLAIGDGPPENSCRPAADVLFRTASKVYRSRLLAVVLTGMGHDGLAGSQDVHAAGGQVIAQDEATSVVWGMPGSVARAGLAEQVLPLDDIAGEIVRRAGLPRLTATRPARRSV